MKDNKPVRWLIGGIAFAFILSVVSCATTSQQKLAADRDAINREMPLIAE